MPDPFTGMRKSWTVDENKAVYTSFTNCLWEGHALSSTAMKAAKVRHECLNSRTQAQIRAKVHNIRSGKEKVSFTLYKITRFVRP